MKKVEIERMQRLEEIVERQKTDIDNLERTIDVQTLTITKLTGANEALTELIVRLKNS